MDDLTKALVLGYLTGTRQTIPVGQIEHDIPGAGALLAALTQYDGVTVTNDESETRAFSSTETRVGDFVIRVQFVDFTGLGHNHEGPHYSATVQD